MKDKNKALLLGIFGIACIIALAMDSDTGIRHHLYAILGGLGTGSAVWFWRRKPLVTVMDTKVRASTVGEALLKAERIWEAEERRDHPGNFDSKGNRKDDLMAAAYSKEMARLLTGLAMCARECAREYMKEEQGKSENEE